MIGGYEFSTVHAVRAPHLEVVTGPRTGARQASRASVASDGCCRRGRVLMTLLAARTRTGVNKGRNQSGSVECVSVSVRHSFLPGRQPGSSPRSRSRTHATKTRWVSFLIWSPSHSSGAGLGWTLQWGLSSTRVQNFRVRSLFSKSFGNEWALVLFWSIRGVYSNDESAIRK